MIISFSFGCGLQRFCQQCKLCVYLCALTCCAGHTSHSGGPLIPDIHCRMSTDHRPPLAPARAAVGGDEIWTSKTFNLFVLEIYKEKNMCIRTQYVKKCFCEILCISKLPRKKKKVKVQICLFLQVLLLNAWQPQSNVTGTVCSFGLRALWYTVLPIYAGIDWHWLARLPRDQSTQPGQIPRPVAMATARPDNRWRWHFWLMSRHRWVKAVTLGLAARKRRRRHQCRKLESRNRGGIISTVGK